METIEISKLIPHPRNAEFFDDIQGDNWGEFLKSIQTSGIIEPIVISNNYVIVSGHQRVRACKELGIKDIQCRIKIYDSDDVILKELLETNLRQRGIGNLNPVKLARCIVELERIYGIRQGSAGGNGTNQYSKELDGDNLPEAKKQTDLAKELSVDDRQLRDYKKLLTLAPEFQDWIQTGKMPPTVGYKVWAKLSREDQSKLIEELGADTITSMTQKQAQQYLEQIKGLENQVAGYERKLANASAAKDEQLKGEIEAREKKIAKLKRDMELLEKKVKLNEDDARKYTELKKSVEELTQKRESLSHELMAISDISGLAEQVRNLLQTKLAPIKYSMTFEQIQSPIVKRNLSLIIESLQSWCNEMQSYLGNQNYIIMEDMMPP